jgi:hypothetical protein
LKEAGSQETQRVGRSRRKSIAEWLQRALRLKRLQEFLDGASKKLEAICTTAKHDFLASDIEDSLGEIESRDSASPQL